MFRTAKSKFIFQSVCSVLTIAPGAYILLALLQLFSGSKITWFADITYATDRFLNSITSPTESVQIFLSVLVAIICILYILGFILSGGAKCAFSLYASAVRGAFNISGMVVINLILTSIVGALGFFFVLALAPFASFYSAISNYLISKKENNSPAEQQETEITE